MNNQMTYNSDIDIIKVMRRLYVIRNHIFPQGYLHT